MLDLFINVFILLLAITAIILIPLTFATKAPCSHEYAEATYKQKRKPVYICKLCGKMKKRKLH